MNAEVVRLFLESAADVNALPESNVRIRNCGIMNSTTFNGDNHGLQNGVNNGSITINLNSREDEEQSRILDWLSTNNQNAKQADTFDRRHEDTGQWILQTKEYQRWFNPDHDLPPNQRTLYCYGTQGAGKTVISAIVIDELRLRVKGDNTAGIAFFYCNHRERVTCGEILASLLRQLLGGNTSGLKTLYDNSGGTRPRIHEIWRLLSKTISNRSRVFIVIDALDETPFSEGYQGFLEKVFSIQEKCDLRLFVTSRKISVISDLFDKSPCLPIRACPYDIEKFLKRNLEDLRFVHGRPGLRQEIISKIMKAADGMFLLAKLQLQCLSSAFGIISPHEETIYKKLENLPITLEEAFDETMNRINSQSSCDAMVAKQALAWILCATRPLSPLELQHALAVESCEASSEEYLYHTKEIVSVCAGLVTVDEESDVIRLDHYAILEYFVQNQTRFFPNADSQLATSCLSYLSKRSHHGFFDTIDQHEDHLRTFPLYEYSATNWGYHAGRSYEDVQEQVKSFFLSPRPLVCSLQTLCADKHIWRNKNLSKVSPLHPASYFGLDEFIKYLLKSDLPSCDSRDGNGQTALHWAIRNGQSDTAELLLCRGINVNLEDNEGKTGLHHAVIRDDLLLIAVLVKHAADMEYEDLNGQTPLLTALQRRNFQSAHELIRLGASIHPVDYMHRNALHYSTIVGSCGIPLTNLLLSMGTSPHLCDVENMTPLHHAIRNGSIECADSLIQAGVCVNAGIERRRWVQTKAAGRWVYQTLDNYSQCPQKEIVKGLTPLHWAALIGYPKMIDYLLARGADPNKRNQDGETPLHLTIKGDICEDYGDAWNQISYRIEVLDDLVEDPGSEEANEARCKISEIRLVVLDSLLSHISIDVDLQDGQMQTPLHLVTCAARDSMRSFLSLMKKQPDLSIRNNKGQTPLHLASRAGELEIVRRLLLAGSSVTATDDQGFNPLKLCLSSEKCSVAVVELLLQHHDMTRANPCLQTDDQGMNLLHHHVQSGECSENIICMLLDHGANINGIDANGDSPLSLYLRTTHLIKSASLCRYLLARHASHSWTDYLGRNLAHIVMYSVPFHPLDEIFHTLREFSVDFTAKDLKDRGVIHHAAKKGLISQGLIDLLRSDGSLFLSDQDVYGQTPLSYAAQAVERQSALSYAGIRYKWYKLTLEILLNVESESIRTSNSS